MAPGQAVELHSTCTARKNVWVQLQASGKVATDVLAIRWCVGRWSHAPVAAGGWPRTMGVALF